MNNKDKIDKLETMRLEVQDFHPFLNELFKRMGEFNRVEYTQGNREFGADFVLESIGNFGELQYTGVVVKVGKITQNTIEIERQIDECFTISRTFDNGNKDIKISKVIVITNSNVTKNAQDWIHSKFGERSILFQDRESLINLVDKHYEEYWKDSRVLLNKVLDKQEEKARSMCIENILGFDSDINYVDMEIKKKDIRNKDFKISNFRNANTLDGAMKISNPILVEGNMGSGKSVLLAKHALSMIQKYKKGESDLLPLVLEFSDYNKDPIIGIETEINKNINEIKNDVENPKFIVYIDGLDEYNLSLDGRKEFIKELHSLISKYQSFKFILTTRTIEDYEFEVYLEEFFDQYSLRPLKHNQIMSIVKSFYSPENNVGSQIAESSLFNMLPRTPITAILLGQILKSDPKEIPSTLTELYSKFMEVVLSRWDSNDLKSQTEYEVLTYICGKFSYYLLENSLSAISIDELKEIIREYLEERNLKINSNEVFDKMAGNSEIFHVSYERNIIRFRHRSFSEYFYAYYIHKNNKHKISEEIYNPYWQNSYFFYFGIVKDSSALLKELSSIDFSNYGLRILQVIANSELLLAAYLTPYKDIKSQVDFSLDTAATAVLDILDDDNQMQYLRSLDMSKFDLIMLITVIVSKNYHYDFYEKALKDIGDNILRTTNNFSDPEWLKIFFVTATLAERGDNDYIELLTKQHNEKKIKLDSEKLNILFHIIYQYNLTPTNEVKRFLKIYQRNFKKGSKGSKIIQNLLKNGSATKNIPLNS